MRPIIIIVCSGFLLIGSSGLTIAQSDADTLYRTSALRDSVQKVILRFEKQIKQFEKEDSIHLPPANSILFVGSSSIRGWQTLKTDFAGYPVIGRGFGGSTFVELLYYLNRIVIKYKPKKVFVYCGENDMTLPYSLPGDVWYAFAQFDSLMLGYLPKTQIYFISIKPCPRSWDYWPKIQLANNLIKAYINQDRSQRLTYIDITQTLLKNNGDVNPALFLSDGIHLQKSVYKQWADIIRPFLD